MADDAVSFDWDQANAEHIARHSVKPDEAEQAIRNDPLDVNMKSSEAKNAGRRSGTPTSTEFCWWSGPCEPTLYGSSPHGLLEGGRGMLICVPKGC